MDKKEAINWCNVNLKAWPVSTKEAAPFGWAWYVARRPYCEPCYFLNNGQGERIVRSFYFME